MMMRARMYRARIIANASDENVISYKTHVLSRRLCCVSIARLNHSQRFDIVEYHNVVPVRFVRRVYNDALNRATRAIRETLLTRINSRVIFLR